MVAGLLLLLSSGCSVTVSPLPETDASAGEADAAAGDDAGLGSADASLATDAGAQPVADAAVPAGVDASSPPDAAPPGEDAGLDASAPAADTGPARPAIGDHDDAGRALVWAEEFDGPAIDRTRWGNELGLVRNNERQCYTADAKNQFIENGELVIRGLPESACGGTFTSASLTTEGFARFKYGRLEASILVPTAKGSWPAFWLLPANKATYGSSWWPAGGEIDVMEFVTQTPKVVYGTAHFLRGGTHGSSGSSTTLAASVGDEHHVFAIEWDATHIDWFVDTAKYHSFDTSGDVFDGFHPFQDEFYVILNYAIGGSWPEGGGQVPDPVQYPDEMRVDWVRYWK